MMAYRSFSINPSFSGNIFSDRFNRIDNLFSRLTGDTPLSYAPVYNLFQKNNGLYELIISVPGYSENELDIQVQNNQLTIKGNHTCPLEKAEDIKWLHKGISNNEFSLSFNLDNRIKVKNASLADGLLKLKFEYEIPEEEKSKKITISSEENKHKIGHKQP